MGEKEVIYFLFRYNALSYIHSLFGFLGQAHFVLFLAKKREDTLLKGCIMASLLSSLILASIGRMESGGS